MKNRRGSQGHITQKVFQLRHFEVIKKAHTWNGKWAGPEGASYASDVKWDYYGIEKLSDLTIQSIYMRRIVHTMLVPECTKMWNKKLGRDDLLWDKIWQQLPAAPDKRAQESHGRGRHASNTW